MSTITWLHLSDLHFRAGERHTWDEDIVLRALLDDVQTRTEDGLTADMILVSGDIAFSGAPSEYAQARVFFDALLAATGLPKEQLLVVPGNHDVDRRAITRGAAAIASSLDNRQAVAGGSAEAGAPLLRAAWLDCAAPQFVEHYHFII